MLLCLKNCAVSNAILHLDLGLIAKICLKLDIDNLIDDCSAKGIKSEFVDTFNYIAEKK